MLLTNFRKSVNQGQVEGTGHTLSRCIYLCRAHEPQPLLYNIRGTLCVYLAWHHLKAAMHPPFCTLTAHPNMQPTAPSARSRVSSTQCLAKAGLSFFGDYPVPLKETNWTRTEAPSSTTNYIRSGAPEMQVTEWQNEGEESQGFLSMWQCWNGDIKHNSVNYLVFYSTETQQNFSHISLMRNRHRNHWHQPKIFQSCFKSQLTGVTHKPPSFTVDPKHSSNQFNQPAERALAQQE